jgi:hypothetical protein
MKDRMHTMSRVLRIMPWLAFTLLTALMAPFPALAALGGDVASVQADQARINASQRITGAAAYSVYELRTPVGTVVREYVSAAGTVFAVAWRGPLLPDLRQIMGDYFAPYTEAAARQRGSRGYLLIQQTDLVVESSGHVRAFFGKAYLPQMLPQDMAVSEIQ